MLTQKELKRLFNYNEEDGKFTRLVTVGRGKRCKAGEIAGYAHKSGYRFMKISGKAYAEHRVVWMYVFGEFPDGEIDHIDHVRGNNRIKNVRVVTRIENMKNQLKRDCNKSGFTGVRFHKATQKWVANITNKGKQLHLGLYEDIKDAVIARREAEIRYGYSPTHGK